MSEVARRNKANRGKGKRFEYECRDGFRGFGFDVEWLRDSGTKDEGDLVIRDHIDGQTYYTVIEAKNAKFEPGVFINEATVETAQFAERRGLGLDVVSGIAVVKRRGHNLRKAFVLSTVEDYFDLEPVA